MKLWVDDIRNPEAFRPGENFHWAKTVTEAIRILDTQDVEEVSLDHDISMKVSVGYGDARPFCSPETYEPVARFIRLRILDDITSFRMTSIRKVTLHTANAVGAEKMKSILSPISPIVEVVVSLGQPCNRFEEDAACPTKSASQKPRRG